MPQVGPQRLEANVLFYERIVPLVRWFLAVLAYAPGVSEILVLAPDAGVEGRQTGPGLRRRRAEHGRQAAGLSGHHRRLAGERVDAPAQRLYGRLSGVADLAEPVFGPMALGRDSVLDFVGRFRNRPAVYIRRPTRYHGARRHAGVRTGQVAV